MSSNLLRRAIATVVACAVLVVIGTGTPKAVYRDPRMSKVRQVIRMMRDRHLNNNVTEDQVAGYYEGLLAGKPVNLLAASQQSDEYRFRADYLYYEAKPHLNAAYGDAQLRHVTNSRGMPDVEYSLERQPRTRRLALLGDSVTRGQGAPFGENYESLLERHLNTSYVGSGIDKYELLNFSNSGYRLTQLVDVALEKVPPFKPDVYVVCLTQMISNRKWGDHVAQLVWDGIDLKYPFLRELAQAARLDPRDPPGTMDAKLALHRLPAIRWALTTIQSKARQEGAEFLVILVPVVNSPKTLETAFAGLRELLRELDEPTIDLLDTFEGVDDLMQFKPGEGDVHPNQDGHRRISEALKRRIENDDKVARIVLGNRGAGRRADP